MPLPLKTQGNSADVSILVASGAEPKDYKFTVTAADVDGTEAKLNVVISVYGLKLYAYPESVNLTAGGASRIVTVTADGIFTNTDLSWDITSKAGLTVEHIGTSSSTRRQYTIGAPQTATAGTHTVVIQVTDGTNTATLNINAIVTASSITPVISDDINSGGSVITPVISDDINSGGNSGGSGTDTLTKQLDFINNNSNITKDSIKEVSESLLSSTNFINALRSKLASYSNVTPAALNVNAFSSVSRTVPDVTENFDNENEAIILALPILEKGTIEEAKVYVFVVDIFEKLRAALESTVIATYSPLYVRTTKITDTIMNVDSVVSLSEENSSKGMFLDDDGKELFTANDIFSAISNGKNINIAAYLEPDTNYSIVITAADDSSVIGPSGAGCIAGSALGLIAMMLSSGIFHIRKKAKGK